MTRNIDIKKDRLRYTKNSTSSTQAYIAILFNVLYFVSVYSYNEYAGEFYHTFTIGLSVICNLLFLLMSFLFSEGVKNYKLAHCIAFIPLGVFQVIRIFNIPLSAYTYRYLYNGAITRVMDDKQFIYTCVCLGCSALACFATAFTGIRKTKMLREYEESLANNNQ